MKYKLLGNYKYQVIEDITIQTEIKNIGDSGNPYVNITADGLVRISKGYSWDGPSGPTIDTKTFIRGSLIHDALYQLMREGYVDRKYRDYSDRLLRDICIDVGMNRFRAWYIYISLKWFGEKNAKPIKKFNKIYEAP